MSKRRTLMGTACVIAMAALAVGPAAADTLTDFAGNVFTAYTSTNYSQSGSNNTNAWTSGGTLGGPLSDFSGLNFQVQGSYTHAWQTHFSEETWTFGGDIFWAAPEARIGIDGNYTNYSSVRVWNTSGTPSQCTNGNLHPSGGTLSDALRNACLLSAFGGHQTSGGAFGEYYYGGFTGMAKGGWFSGGGSGFPLGGHGNYLAGGVTGYATPDLAITGSVDWEDVTTGLGCRVCGRGDVIHTSYSITGEFLVNEMVGISGFAGYTYVQNSDFKVKSHDNVFLIGLRWYTGGGPLIDRHRNGNLNPFLIGP